MKAVRQHGRVWSIPLALAIVTIAGLLSALLGDQLMWKEIAWLCLIAPVVTAAWCALRRRRA
jgi:hypothetical protein